MARDVTIRVIATDQASPVFRTIGQNAAQATNTIDQGNQRAARSYEDLERRAVAVGAAIGTLALGMAAAGQAAAEQEQQVRGIEVAYGDAADELLKFAEHMQDVTNFSNDAARQAELTAATITQQYGIATDQVDDLVMRSADLAQVFGYDLADATSRVTSAIRGEAEAAEALGIAMSDTALQAYAAANGMTGWNTTMTEAEKAQVRFQVLMEQTAYVSGEAQRAHESTRGTVMELANEFQDAGAKVGEFLGPLGETMSVLGNMSLILPVVGAGLGKLVTGLGAAGLPAATLVPLLLGAGAAYIGTEAIMNRDATGSSVPFSAVNYGFYGAGSALNAVLPGNPFNTQKYMDTLASNDVEQVLKGLFYFNPASDGDISNQDLFDRLVTAGILAPIPTGAQISGDPDKFYEKQFIQVQQMAASMGMTTGQFVNSRLTAPNSTFVWDPVSQSYMDLGEYEIYTQERNRAQARANGQMMLNAPFGAGLSSGYYPGVPRLSMAPPGIDYLGGGGGVVANDINGQFGRIVTQPNPTSAYTAIGGQPGMIESGNQPGATERTEDPGWFPKRTGTANPQADFAGYAETIKSVTQALIEQYPAYEGLITGINSASDAQKAFKATQDGLLESQTVYTQQISEFSSQVNAQDAAYEILQKRQEDGIALTEEQTEFMNNYAEANERGTGAIEDATIAQGMLAQQYLLNMKQGDEMNAMLAGQVEATGGLQRAIENLILAMDGVPTEVKTEILLNRADESVADLINYYNWLMSIPGYVGTTVETRYVVTGSDGAVRERGAMHGVTAYANGGTAYDPLMPRFANGGGMYALVGEVGPELVKLPGGAQVMPTGASQDQMRRMRQGGGSQFANYGIVNLQAPTGDAFDALAGSVMGDVW